MINRILHEISIRVRLLAPFVLRHLSRVADGAIIWTHDDVDPIAEMVEAVLMLFSVLRVALVASYDVITQTGRRIFGRGESRRGDRSLNRS